MGGVYNKYQDDGMIIDKKRRVRIFALDYNTTLPKIKTFITSELLWIKVDVPSTYGQQFGSKQFGGFMDIVQPLLKKNILGWENAVLNLACRFDELGFTQNLRPQGHRCFVRAPQTSRAP